MTDIQRIIQILLEITSTMRIHERYAPECSESLRSLRIRYWYEVLRQRTGLNSAYQLEKHIEPMSFARNPDGSVRYYKNKWIHYETAERFPQAALLKKVEESIPGSTRDLHHPLWLVLNCENQEIMQGDTFLNQLAPPVWDLLFMRVEDGGLGYSVRVAFTPQILEKLERIASLDALACLVWLLREAAEKKSDDAVRIGHALHNLLTIMALELYTLKIALPLLQLFIEYILPLGVPPYRRLCMSSFDYVYASGYLNRIVYETLNAPELSLDWSERVKIMQQLMQGKFGLDVLFAMRPKFELDDASGEIPVEVLKEHDISSGLRAWGWCCVETGKRLPLEFV